MEKPEMIYSKMIAVLRDIGAISKDRVNQGQGFKFRGIDQFLNECHQHFATHGIFMTTKVLEMTREERTTGKGGLLIYTMLKVEYTWWAEDGSSVSSVIQGEGMDSGDKSCNKALAVALKYALMQAFSVPTEEMLDPDGDSHQPKPKAQVQPEPKPEPKPQVDQSKPASEKQIGMIQKLLNEREVDEKGRNRAETMLVIGFTSIDASKCIDYLTSCPKKGVTA